MPKQRARRRKAAPTTKARAVPHYGQTAYFTCGPSSAIMAMKALKPSVRADRALELQLRREANTIFMEPSGREARAASIPVRYDSQDIEGLAAALCGGALPITLNSMEFLHNDPTAHWFVVTEVDENSVYVNDPWVDHARGKTARDMSAVSVSRAPFESVTSSGKKRERAAVLVRCRSVR